MSISSASARDTRADGVPALYRDAAAGPGKLRRLGRLGHDDGRFLFVPMDHSISDGPIASVPKFRRIVTEVAAAGADAIVVHKGRAATIADLPLGTCALIVHLSASTRNAPDADAKVLVGSVEDAVRLGADGVSIHVNFGSATESEQLRDFGDVATACATFGMPLLAMVYARGPNVADPLDPVLLSHITNVAVDLGADIVKTSPPRLTDELPAIVDNCAAHLVISGGPRADDDDYGLIRLAEDAVAAGAAGLAVGRRVWADPDPAGVVGALTNVVHPARAHR
ncbi:2-amino-3,7-dideoxy-D-threo-hept-6-ulosonate synthase [Symbioplanes lichenis]|uniref:2-amino-3,7-dideoxy-D-threo-hept-6-ulosonate synthase n=1 Tax=Symbioplanes lichenis TaxID=1629072 RepID=UPI002738DB86|nr:2-amino-3,7-dideoxy-D-threo-hept-6-ulosonate synthase [Actinoplanes lichenis]